MTAATQLAVFYATDSKILRRKVIPNDEAQLEGLSAGPGESMLLLPLARPYDDASCRAAIAAATGVRPPVVLLMEKTLIWAPVESVTSKNFPEAAVSILPVIKSARSAS